MSEAPGTGDFTPAAVTLRGGRRVTLREVRPGDEAALAAALKRLSGESRYLRFMAAVNELPPAMLKQRLVPGRDLALVAVEDPAGADGQCSVVGGARYLVDPARPVCEFAIAVTDDWSGTGLASRLMQELIGSARARGLHGMEGHILARNARMLALARRKGFAVTPDREEPGVVYAWLDLRAGTADQSREP